MAKVNPYASVESNENWNETQEVKSLISIKTRTGFDGGEILEMVKLGRDLPDTFLENSRIESVTVTNEVITTLTRKEK